MKELKKQSENSSKENESWTPLFLLKVFEMLEETTRKHGENHPKVKESWALFKELAEPHLNLKGSPTLNSIKTDTSVTRQLLGFNPVPTVEYGFIKSENVRMQLHLDNLKMESVLSNPKQSLSTLDDFSRFKHFCTYCCYQVEELLNYLLFQSVEDHTDFLNYYLKEKKFAEFEDETKRAAEIERRIQNPSSIGFIDLYDKINWFCYNRVDDKEKWGFRDSLTGIRKVRNEELHRFSALENKSAELEDEYKKLLNRIRQTVKNGGTYNKSQKEWRIESEGKYLRFVMNRDYNRVRATLVGMVGLVKDRVK